MRGLLKAFLLAPAVVSAFLLSPDHVADTDAELEWIAAEHADTHATAYVRLDIGQGSKSPENGVNQALSFRLDVYPSDQPCGFGNLTLDGQVLAQNLDRDTLVSSGKGSVSTSTKNVIVGSWTFDCIVVNGKPDGQLLQFIVDSVDGNSVEDVAFSVLFKQTGKTEIMNIEIQPLATAHIIANHSPEDHHAKGHYHNGGDSKSEHKNLEGHYSDHPNAQGPQKYFNIHKEIDELKYMEAQLDELKWLIHKKRHAIRTFNHDSRGGGIRNCDSIRCVARKTYDGARVAASKIYGKITGDNPEFHHLSDLHPRKHEGRKMNEKLGNGFYGRPSNRASRNHDKNNHTSSHLHHHGKRPILPICHYPPPFPAPHPHGHGPSPPHMSPPEFRPPGEFGNGGRPPMPQQYHGDQGSAPWDYDSRPQHHNSFGGPLDHEEEHGDDLEEVRPPFHEGKDNDRQRHSGSSHENEPSLFDVLGKPDHLDGPPPFGHQEQNEFEDIPYHGPPHVPDGAEHEFDDPPFGEHPSFHDGPAGSSGDHGPPPHHGPGPILDVIKFSSIGFLFAILIITIRCRTFNPKRRAARHGRREERHRKRAYRCAASRYALSTWWARLIGGGDNYDYEEKREALLDDIDSDAESTMSDDITTFQNTANIVSDMVAAEEGRSMSSAQTQPQPIATETRHMGSVIEDYASDAEEEVLPAYEDNDDDDDGSEASSFVADGFRYTPGSSDYSPSHSANGGVGDILGNDSKQYI